MIYEYSADFRFQVNSNQNRVMVDYFKLEAALFRISIWSQLVDVVSFKMAHLLSNPKSLEISSQISQLRIRSQIYWWL